MEKISWADCGLDARQPVSSIYQDVYFSRAGAFEEYRHVFHLGNRLPERWRHSSSFKIGELGFGTGLGFLFTVLEWRTQRAPGAQLHYLSFEKHPINPKTDLARIHETHGAGIPGFSALASELRLKYPAPIEGIHRITLNDVSLTLVFGDANQWARQLVLPQGANGIDAWFLHGFSPQKNPGLWTLSLFEQLARLSTKTATASTFSVAALVHENLTQAGFEVERAAGFAQKREMLKARIKEKFTLLFEETIGLPFTALPPAMKNPRIAVIGAGLAGSAAVYSLASRGKSVTLFDSANQIASGASGNPVGFFMPFLATQPDPKCKIALRALSILGRNLSSLGIPSDHPGALELATSLHEKERLQCSIEKMALPPEIARSLSAEEARETSGLGSRLQAPHGGILYPTGGIISPQRLCETYLSSFNSEIELRLNTPIQSLRRTDQQWELIDPAGQIVGHFDAVIVANAHQATRLLPQCELPFTAVRGQVACFETGNTGLEHLRLPLIADRYLTPALEGMHVLGATHRRGDLRPALDPDENEDLWNSLRERIADLPQATPQSGRVGFRAYAPDAIAAIGPAADYARYSALYSDLSRGFPTPHYPPAELLPALFTSVAHGSRGIASSALGGDLIASLVNGEILPLERELAESLHPARFALRRLRRRT